MSNDLGESSRRINPQKSAHGTIGKSLQELAENKIKADSAERDISAEISAHEQLINHFVAQIKCRIDASFSGFLVGCFATVSVQQTCQLMRLPG